MESRFGHDFSHVRIHTDSPAARSAASINALAYTSGNRIVFGHGQYSPETRDGRFLLAHELTHVLQQLGAGSARRHDPVIRRKAGTPAPSLTPAEALAETLATDDGENLIQGFKRANNILTQAEEKDGVEYSYGADIKYAEDDAEKALFAALDAADARIAPAMKAEDFSTAMTAMAALRAPIDAFFTDVQVNADSALLRRNRLNLLSRIRNICLSVADLTKIEG